MFSTALRGGKAFAAEQKLRELKKRLSRLLVLQRIFLLSSRIKKKSDPSKFYKSTGDKKSFFDKNAIFAITNRQKIDNKISNHKKNIFAQKKFSDIKKQLS